MAIPFPRRPLDRRLKYVLYTLLGLVTLWVVGIVALIVFLQSDYLRAKLSSIGSSKLGREFAIEGPLDIDWHFSGTRVRANQVRLSNIPGSKDANMVEVETVDFVIKPLKLIFGRTELPEVTIVKPKIVLERGADGTANWQFPKMSSTAVATNAVVPKERGDFPIIGTFTITDGQVIYRDAVKKLDFDLKLSTLSAEGGENKKDAFKLNGKGTLSGKTFDLDASGGSLLSLRDSSKDYPLNVSIVMGDTSVKVDGTFRDPLKMTGVDAKLAVKGPNLADLYYLTSIPLPPTPAYSLSGQIAKAGDVWRFDIPAAKVGNSDLKAAGTYDTGRERGYLKADLESNKMYLDDLGGLIGLKPKGNETVAPSDRLFPDMPLNLERMRKTDLNVKLVARSLIAPGWPFQSLDLTFNLDNGLLKVEPANAGIAGGTMTGHLYLDGRKDVPHVDADIMLRRLSMKQFFGSSKFGEMTSGTFGGRFNIAGNGKSLADVLASADGRISVLMAGGKISLTLVEAAGLDVAQVAPLLLGDDRTTGIRCAVGDFAVKNGLLTSDVFDFDTEDTNLFGNATIDLKSETIDAKMEAHPKDASPLTARTPITIKGPLKKPGIGVEVGGLAAKGGIAAALALLNPLAAVLPFIDMGGGEDTDCRALIQEVRARHGGDIAGPSANQAPPVVKEK